MDNKKCDDTEQIKVHIKSFPTLSEAQGYKSFRVSEGGGVEIVYPNDSVMLTRHIGKIENCEHDNQDEDQIKDGSSLGKSKVLEYGPLVSEIREYLLDASEPISEGEN